MFYPIGIQNFEKLRNGGFVYVDKTEHLYNLVRNGSYYFLSRPRRFGKSLLLSTIDAYMSGKKELFAGLAIDSMEKDWIHYPVLHLDLSGKTYSDTDSLNESIGRQLDTLEKIYGIMPSCAAIDTRFSCLIDTAAQKTGRQVVILIDEYDKPIVDNLNNDALADFYRSQLQGFYGVMKSKDAKIKLGFLTGVTKIGKLSVFSGLNNLKDISLDSRYYDICGITDKDIHDYFSSSVEELASANGFLVDDCYEKLKDMYDGYHFSHNMIGIYNPFSLLNTFDSHEFREYWFETGTPSFLVKVMTKTSYDVSRLSDEEADAVSLMDIDSDFMNPVPLLYQSGYLTIKGYDPEYSLYRLGFPNREVRHGFLGYLMKYYTPATSDSGIMLITRMAKEIHSGNAEGFMQKLEALFSRTTYQIQGNSEKDFQYAMYIILELMGEYVEAEHATSNGRIDISLQTKNYIYIIEIKINDTAEAALRQIESKGYARRFSDDSRKIFRIGVRFSSESRCIEDWKID